MKESIHELKKHNSKLYKLLFWVLGISIISILFSILIMYHIWFKQQESVQFTFNDTIVTILTVLGVFIAFSAINIYSVFNSTVDAEKEALRSLEDRFDQSLRDFKEKVDKINYIDNLTNQAESLRNSFDMINQEYKDFKKIVYEPSELELLNQIYLGYIPLNKKAECVKQLTLRLENWEKKVLHEQTSDLDKIEFDSKKKELLHQIKLFFEVYEMSENEEKNNFYNEMIVELKKKI